MPVTDEMVAAMRAYLMRDYEQFRRRNSAFDGSRTQRRAFLALLTAAFVKGVQRRFPESPARDEIIDFVAELRARGDELRELEPNATERMIELVFDDSVEVGDIDGKQSIGIRLSVLAQIFYDEDPDSAELEDFLDRSRAFADEMLG